MLFTCCVLFHLRMVYNLILFLLATLWVVTNCCCSSASVSSLLVTSISVYLYENRLVLGFKLQTESVKGSTLPGCSIERSCHWRTNGMRWDRRAMEREGQGLGSGPDVLCSGHSSLRLAWPCAAFTTRRQEGDLGNHTGSTCFPFPQSSTLAAFSTVSPFTRYSSLSPDRKGLWWLGQKCVQTSLKESCFLSWSLYFFLLHLQAHCGLFPDCHAAGVLLCLFCFSGWQL